jgi:hypothetical protein
MTLAWPGWKQRDIAVEVERARLETSRFKKCCINCVLLYYPSAEFKSAFNVSCYPVQNCPCVSFLSWGGGGACRHGGKVHDIV